jgi:hypothetical protein
MLRFPRDGAGDHFPSRAPREIGIHRHVGNGEQYLMATDAALQHLSHGGGRVYGLRHQGLNSATK